MKYFVTVFFSIFFIISFGFSQTIVKLKKENGVALVPCSIDSVSVNAVIDNTAANDSISLNEAMDMCQDNKIEPDDLIGVEVNTNNKSDKVYIINIKEIDIAGVKLKNVQAIIAKNNVPFVIGKSTIKKLGDYSPNNNTLKISTGNTSFDYSADTSVYLLKDTINTAGCAEIDVTIIDENQKPITNALIAFKGQKYNTPHQAFINNDGKLSIDLPSGDFYEIHFFEVGSHGNSTVFQIPALKPRSHYGTPFKISIVYQAPKKIVINDCYFELNNFVLSPKYNGMLDSIALYLQSSKDRKIKITGYTEASETNRDTLGMSRAKAVQEYIISKGKIDESQIQIEETKDAKSTSNTNDDAVIINTSNKRAMIKVL